MDLLFENISMTETRYRDPPVRACRGWGDLVPLGRVFKLSKAVTFSDLNFRALN